MTINNRQPVRSFDSLTLSSLQTSLQGKVILPDHPEYSTVRKIWNGHIDRYPSIIVRCTNTHDVAQAVRFARAQNLEIAVRSGGHGIPGYATLDGGIIIDLSPMKEIIVDPVTQTAVASAGLTLGEFARATEAYGLHTTTGTVSDTGLAGLAVGGGMGYLMSKYGLTCDNVRLLEVVTAEGQIVRASAGENPDLFWALRGGGGNFGIVTTFEMQLHPLKAVLGGLIAHPFPRAREVLRFYRDFNQTAPDELTVYAAIITTPDGHPAVGLIPCYFGDDLSEGERLLEPLRKFGPPVLDAVHPQPYTEIITLIDAANPPGHNYYDKGINLPALTDDVIDLLVEAGASRTSPMTAILIQHCHGAAARVDPSATAFAARGESYMPLFISHWTDGPAEPHIEWSRSAWKSLQPYGVDAGYVNFMNDEDQKRLPQAYGANYPRLLEIKRKWDPQNVFHRNLNIKP